jgi:hypothetical protein
MILTDRPGWDYFSWSLNQSDDKVILIQGHDQHLMATHAAPSSSLTGGSNNSSITDPSTTQGRPFRHPSMVYKRFKTLLVSMERVLLLAHSKDLLFVRKRALD